MKKEKTVKVTRELLEAINRCNGYNSVHGGQNESLIKAVKRVTTAIVNIVFEEHGKGADVSHRAVKLALLSSDILDVLGERAGADVFDEVSVVNELIKDNMR